MIGKTTRLVLVACGVMCIMCIGLSAHAATVQSVMESTLDGMTNPNPTTVWPLLFDDKDRTLVEDITTGTDFFGNTGVTGVSGVVDLVGERIKGILLIQSLDSGATVDTTDVFRDTYSNGVIQSWGEGQLTTSFSGQGVELAGAFYLEAVGIATAAAGDTLFGVSAPDGWVKFKAVPNSGLQTMVNDARSSNVTIESDAAIALFEDTSPDFTTAGWTGDLPNAVDGSLWATVGFTPGDSTDSDFYYVHSAWDATTTSYLSNFFAFSLDFLTDTGPAAVTYPGPIENEFGTTVAGSGTLTEPSTGGYVKSSDADFKVLYAPVPAAVYPGMLLLMGLGALRRRMRRKAEM